MLHQGLAMVGGGGGVGGVHQHLQGGLSGGNKILLTPSSPSRRSSSFLSFSPLLRKSLWVSDWVLVPASTRASTRAGRVWGDRPTNHLGGGEAELQKEKYLLLIYFFSSLKIIYIVLHYNLNLKHTKSEK